MVRKEMSKSGNVEFTIDEEKKVITATIKCSGSDAEKIFDSLLRKSFRGHGRIGFVFYHDGYKKNVCINKEYTGKAKCHQSDEFDIKFGKRLALLRAKNKYLRAVNNALYKMVSVMDDVHASAEKMFNKHYRYEIDNSSEIYRIEKETGLY